MQGIPKGNEGFSGPDVRDTWLRASSHTTHARDNMEKYCGHNEASFFVHEVVICTSALIYCYIFGEHRTLKKAEIFRPK